MKTTIYGIKNCNTMKKTFDWLAEHAVVHVFHDYKKNGIDKDTLSRWCAKVGWQTLVNTRGTTWRKLDPALHTISNDEEAIALMIAHNSVIKRPVIELADHTLLVGFDEVALARSFPSGADA